MGFITVAGLDPAFANFGIARMHLDLDTLSMALVRFRTISTEATKQKKVIRKNSDDLRRAAELHDAMHEEMAGCTLAFAEIPSGAQHARAAFGFGVAVGVLASCKIPLLQVMPLETKIHSVNNKKAEKPEIISWAAGLFPDADWLRYEKDTRNKKGHLANRAGDLHLDNEHVADAIAIIHAGVRLPEFKQSLALLRATAKAA
jgi:hypothetical protein